MVITTPWESELLERVNRKTIEIAFDPHLFERTAYWNLELDKVEETVREGKIFPTKCEEPNKLCFKKYFGKENTTYTVIVRMHKDFMEVKTVWPNQGR